jgi:hypothetical protein
MRYPVPFRKQKLQFINIRWCVICHQLQWWIVLCHIRKVPHIRLVLNLRINGAILLLSHIPSWYRQGTLYLLFRSFPHCPWENISILFFNSSQHRYPKLFPVQMLQTFYDRSPVGTLDYIAAFPFLHLRAMYIQPHVAVQFGIISSDPVPSNLSR